MCFPWRFAPAPFGCRALPPSGGCARWAALVGFASLLVRCLSFGFGFLVPFFLLSGRCGLVAASLRSAEWLGGVSSGVLGRVAPAAVATQVMYRPLRSLVSGLTLATLAPASRSLVRLRARRFGGRLLLGSAPSRPRFAPLGVVPPAPLAPPFVATLLRSPLRFPGALAAPSHR